MWCNESIFYGTCNNIYVEFLYFNLLLYSVVCDYKLLNLY